MGKKIGVITHYYKSNNYGGLLQAYAMVHYLNSRGFEAEQLCWKLLKRNRDEQPRLWSFALKGLWKESVSHIVKILKGVILKGCLLYTSDAADDKGRGKTERGGQIC